MKTLRCAIYTRKSTEEGLDQAFNSLHAQREACEAYVLSQAGEGWTALPTLYDDGGVSGGTMERPALKALMSDIEKGRVDVVVVYRVDRLTRSLADFAKIVERFDAKTVSFVSVTQAFNTTNSMGRLTLNVLLSFAQFEREVTGERIRDKIAASRAKGMWMGGTLPYGYAMPTDPVSRALVLAPDEAKAVRNMFERYLVLGSVHALVLELDQQGNRTPLRTFKSGTQRGGVPWGRGAIYNLLRNRTYLGEVVHKGNHYPNCHPPVVPRELFEDVQAKLDANLAERRRRPSQPDGSPLCGKLVDAQGVPMTPAMAYGKLGRKYRYYVSRPLQTGRANSLDRSVIRRTAAGPIEALVHERVQAMGMGEDWAGLRQRILRVSLGTDRVTISLAADSTDASEMARLQAKLKPGELIRLTEGQRHTLELTIPGRPTVRGGRTWIATTDGARPEDAPQLDPKLIKALRRGHQLAKTHKLSPLLAVATNAAASAPSDPYERRLVRLAFLAPDIQQAICQGRQLPGLSIDHLMRASLSHDWAEQRRQLRVLS